MRFFLKPLLVYVFLITSIEITAQEIVGVNFVWGKKYLSQPIRRYVFPITVDLYVKGFPFPDNQSFVILAYKKASGKLTNLGIMVTKAKKARRVESSNLKCSDNFNIDVFHEEYVQTQYIFEAFDSFDPQDYYFVLDVCCRPNIVSNFKTNVKPSFAVAFEIPAYKDDNEFNLLPYFKKELNNFYYCKNKPFSIDFGASDFPDREGTKDELRYSFQRPQKGYNKGTADFGEIFKYYPNIKYLDWASGFSASKPLGSGNTLTIDPKTGLITGECNKTGMYTIVVKVEQFRNGKSEGSNLREYTFWVVDCPLQDVAKPQIRINNTIETKYLMCLNAKVQLVVENTPGFVYEWKRNGNVIISEISNVLITQEEGIYTVSASDTRNCLNSVVSEPVELKIKNRRPVISSLYSNVFGCFDKPVTLKLESNEFNREVTWQKFGPTGFVTKGETLTVKETGVFSAKFSSSGCPNDSISLFAGVLIGTKYPSNEPITKDVIVCPRTSFFYNINEDFGTKSRFNWYHGDELVWEGPNRMQLTLPGIYTIYGGEYGCFAKMEVLNVSWGDNCPKDNEENLYLPDAITINGDNINETLDIFNLEAFPDLELFLYDRQGHLILYKSGMFTIYEDNMLWEALKSMIGQQVAYKIKYNRGNIPEKIGKILIMK